MAVIKNCTVEPTSKWQEDEEGFRSGKYLYFLSIRIPLPGGEAAYEIPITNEVKKNLETAAALSEAK